MRSAPGTLWQATELAGLSPDAAGPAERGGLIDLSPDLRFRHPVIRAAVYGSASAQARRQAHGVLAAAARALDDQQAAAWHLAAATLAPAEDVAAELEAAAAVAHDRGSLLNESAFLARAAELSPPGPQAIQRRLRAAEAALLGGAPLRAESLTGLIPPSAPGRACAQAEHLRVQARLATGRSVAEAPAMLLRAGLSCLDEDPGLARGILLEAATATIAASQMTAQVTPGELGGRILGALGDHAPRTGEEHLLTGLATLLTGRYRTAAPLLRQAIGILAADPGLHLGHGEYADAYETATAMRRDDTISMSAEALPAIVEAGLRSGHPTEAAAALADLECCATASGTGWALGLLARSTALMAPPDQAGELYREAIDILGRTAATADLARAHLLFGEWLRRHQRPADARDHLHTALGLFTSMGAIPFARRARSELRAAGAGPDALQPPDSPLTARESQIASMAAAGYANQEIADRLFITTHTVEYHLKKIFRKLGIVSRRQLRDKVGSEFN